MKILVTGATGFIGKNLVKALAEKDYKIRCLVRAKSKKNNIQYLKKLKAKLVYGDVTNKKSLEKVVKGVNVIYHLANLLGGKSISKEEMWKVNVIGTKNLLDASKNERVEKFIYCSSAGILGPVTNGNESNSVNPTNWYEITKAEAEKLVLESGLNYIIVRPGLVYGPRDLHTLPLFRLISQKKGFIIGDGKTLIHPTYVGDVVQVFLKCLKGKVKSSAYIVAGEKPISINQFYDLIAKELKVSINKIHIPLGIAWISAAVNEFFAYIFNKKPLITKSRIKFFVENRTFDVGEAKRKLNYKPIKLEQGIKITVKWYKEKGYLPN